MEIQRFLLSFDLSLLGAKGLITVKDDFFFSSKSYCTL